jgi:hypothetical protein
MTAVATRVGAVRYAKQAKMIGGLWTLPLVNLYAEPHFLADGRTVIGKQFVEWLWSFGGGHSTKILPFRLGIQMLGLDSNRIVDGSLTSGELVSGIGQHVVVGTERHLAAAWIAFSKEFHFAYHEQLEARTTIPDGWLEIMSDGTLYHNAE